MKPVTSAMLIIAVLILNGCGAVGVLEEENVELRDKVDSLSSVQEDIKDRVQYLETQNIELDNKNKQLQSRLTGSGGITPPNYLVTGEKPKTAAPLNATPMNQASKYTITTQPQTAQPVTITQSTQSRIAQSQTESQPRAPQHMTDTESQYRSDEEMQRQPDTPQPAASQAQPWKAERYAVESGATSSGATGSQQKPEKWSYGAQPSSSNASNYDYDSKPSAAPTGKYGQKFDTKKGTERTEYAQSTERSGGWGNYSGNTGNSGTSATNGPRPIIRQPQTSIPEPVQPQTIQRKTVQTQTTRTQTTQTQTQQRVPVTAATQPAARQSEPSASSPLLPGTVTASFADMKRDANYSFLADYQKGLAAFKKADYSACIAVLSGLVQRSTVNNMSDNSDFWIAESYYAIRDFASAKHYYNRVLSYPESDKAMDARQRIASMN